VSILIVVNSPDKWPLHVPGVEVVSARGYVSEARFSDLRGVKVFNLCKSYRYQSLGYYVSLLAEARGHRPMPSITTIQDLKSPTMLRLAADDLEEAIEEHLAHLGSDAFTLSVYFGRNLARKYDRLALKLFNLFPAPLLRAEFVREKTWTLSSIAPIPVGDVPADHRPFLLEVAQEYFAGRRRAGAGVGRGASRFDLAILHNPEEDARPSNDGAIEKFVRAARELGIEADLITRDDYARLAEFDGLFIRETTRVNHHTYRFSRRAAAEGLVVIDDPESIVRCSNKVFLAEMLERHDIGHPRTFIAHKDNIEDIPLYVGFPCVLKQPDSAFSQGVLKATDPAMLERQTRQLLEGSDLVIAQEFVPSEYDWRVGVLDGKPLFVCKYHMAKGHWQIVTTTRSGEREFGKVEAVPVEEAPRRVVSAAVRAAGHVGDGLYGVDVKQVDGKVYVIEVNDNPNIDSGYEDKVLGKDLYLRVMQVFLSRMEARREGRAKV
jgi:glutathione synthase/RimK-type ligase-like ATP-grasp enzyme